jgi:mRNA interferase HigB
MQVHLIKKVSIELYCIQNAQSRSSFEAWLTKLKFANWENSITLILFKFLEWII